VGKESNSLVAVVENATEEQLVELREEIKKTEVKLRGMRKLEGVVAAALGKEESKPGPKRDKPAKSRDSKPDADAETALLEKRKRIAAFLEKTGKTGHDIITNCGIAPAQLADVTNHPWFSKNGNIYHLTPQARRDLY